MTTPFNPFAPQAAPQAPQAPAQQFAQQPQQAAAPQYAQQPQQLVTQFAPPQQFAQPSQQPQFQQQAPQQPAVPAFGQMAPQANPFQQQTPSQGFEDYSGMGEIEINSRPGRVPAGNHMLALESFFSYVSENPQSKGMVFEGFTFKVEQSDAATPGAALSKIGQKGEKRTLELLKEVFTAAFGFMPGSPEAKVLDGCDQSLVSATNPRGSYWQSIVEQARAGSIQGRPLNSYKVICVATDTTKHKHDAKSKTPLFGPDGKPLMVTYTNLRFYPVPKQA
jgi:hypothetical protein